MAMLKQTVTVSIGRNVDGVPMIWDRWQAFAARVEVPFHYWDSSEFVTIHVGRAASVNDSWDGFAEETYTWVVDYPQADLEGFRAHLAVTAREFGQDAIAVTVGDTELVSGRA